MPQAWRDMETMLLVRLSKSTVLHMRKKKQHISSFFNHIASIDKFDSLLLQFFFQEALYENWNTSV